MCPPPPIRRESFNRRRGSVERPDALTVQRNLGIVTIHAAGVARSYLFVPANRPDRVNKAISTGADEVIVDLEDAVSSDEKLNAREDLRALHCDAPVCVRINSVDSEFFDDDVAACDESEFVKGIVVPMVKSSEDVRAVTRRLRRHIAVLALVESAEGILAAEEIASSGASRLMFGSADYCANLAAPPSDELFAYPRSRLVVASAAFRLPPPVDGPTLDFKNESLLTSDLRAARALGMGGKLCIHPLQVRFVRDAYQATELEKEWARSILEESAQHNGAVFAYRGEMVDGPVLDRAHRILEL
jgi:citrate lyase subunit beta/citryl-CoA lyase